MLIIVKKINVKGKGPTLGEDDRLTAEKEYA